jgi:hypothetical protein
MLFLNVQMDQHKAYTLIRNLALSLLSTPLSQLPNMFLILDGGGKLYVKKIIRQIIRAKGHERNKCSIDSNESQKQHF